MIFHETPLQDAYLIELDKKGDERGFFARVFCSDEFGARGLATSFCQVNNSLSVKAGTLRGLHYQVPPHSEVKLVRCVRGRLWDCIVDLRADSYTFGKWFGAELTADNRLMMYVPRGFAHAILTLDDNSESLYLASSPYFAAAERGIRWNDPKFEIQWPGAPTEISAKDSGWLDFDPEFHAVGQLQGLK